ncbi:uncharacterized protein V1513DRAFT_455695 [Lipomyces chichibuensis]|uniref:uncharacterized protein n=1 Tax=Lipomyces chichibuensis TaxID=1546026 RepID=UPI003343D3A3
MSHIFRAIVCGAGTPASRVASIIITFLCLLEIVSAYEHGRLCVSAVFHGYDTFFEGSIQTVVEESGLVVYQEGVDLTKVMRPDYLLIDDLNGSAKVHTEFKVGTHTCTLHGHWSSRFEIPPLVPSISRITCAGSDRIWYMTSSNPSYYNFFQIGNNSPDPTLFYMNYYTMYGMYCGSY